MALNGLVTVLIELHEYHRVQSALKTTLDPYEAGLYAEAVEPKRAGLSSSAYADSRPIRESMGRESIVAYALEDLADDDA